MSMDLRRLAITDLQNGKSLVTATFDSDGEEVTLTFTGEVSTQLNVQGGNWTTIQTTITNKKPGEHPDMFG